jgi:hypothetical protein
MCSSTGKRASALPAAGAGATNEPLMSGSQEARWHEQTEGGSHQHPMGNMGLPPPGT